MKPLHLGYDARNRAISLDGEDRKTHMMGIGASGTGKSKFFEKMLRGELKNRQGFCLVDPHGPLYRDTVNYCGHKVLDRDIILMDLSAGDRVVGFNPFRKSSDEAVSVQVNRRIAATMHAWGVESTDQTPTLERTLRLVYTVMLDQNLGLPQIHHLLDFNSSSVRDHLVDQLQTPLIQAEWRELQKLKASEWRNEILSAKNRLFRFLTSGPLTRFMGITDRTIDLQAVMDEGKVLLVNLARSNQFSAEDARVFGALMVNEFFECAQRRQKDNRGRDPKPYYLYLDEFQEFVSLDIAKMLAESRKFGLFLVLAHQFLEQLDQKLIAAVLTNCGIKAVFGGLTAGSAELMAKELFIGKLNPMKIKAAIYQTKFWPVYGRDKVYSHGTSRGNTSSRSSTTGGSQSSSASSFTGKSRTYSYDNWFSLPQLSGARTESSSRGNTSMSANAESWADGFSEGGSYSESESEADIPIFTPVPFQELSGVQYYSLDEQLTELTAALKEQYARHCFIKLPGQESQPLLVPKVEAFYTPPTNLRRYENTILKNNHALSVLEADALIAAQETALLQLTAAASGVIELQAEAAASAEPTSSKPDVPIWSRTPAASSGDRHPESANARPLGGSKRRL